MEKIKKCKKCGWEFHSNEGKYKNICATCQEKEKKPWSDGLPKFGKEADHE